MKPKRILASVLSVALLLQLSPLNIWALDENLQQPPQVRTFEQVRKRRISVIVSVPKILDVLRDHLLRLQPETMAAIKEAEDPATPRYTLEEMQAVMDERFGRSSGVA